MRVRQWGFGHKHRQTLQKKCTAQWNHWFSAQIRNCACTGAHLTWRPWNGRSTCRSHPWHFFLASPSTSSLLPTLGSSGGSCPCCPSFRYMACKQISTATLRCNLNTSTFKRMAWRSSWQIYWGKPECTRSTVFAKPQIKKCLLCTADLAKLWPSACKLCFQW